VKLIPDWLRILRHKPEPRPEPRPPSTIPPGTRIAPGRGVVISIPPALQEYLQEEVANGAKVAIENGGIIRDGDEFCRQILITLDGETVAETVLHWNQAPGTPPGEAPRLEATLCQQMVKIEARSNGTSQS
jgi:hypothetical protein